MSIIKTTSIPTSSVGYFINKEVSDDGNYLIYYFQVSDYLPDYNLELKPEMYLGNCSKDYWLNDFEPNLKFKFPSSNNSRFNFLLGIKSFGKYEIFLYF